jgi:hypothetical protein
MIGFDPPELTIRRGELFCVTSSSNARGPSSMRACETPDIQYSDVRRLHKNDETKKSIKKSPETENGTGDSPREAEIDLADKFVMTEHRRPS